MFLSLRGKKKRWVDVQIMILIVDSITEENGICPPKTGADFYYFSL